MIDLFLGLAIDHEGDGFVGFEVRATIEAVQPRTFEFHGSAVDPAAATHDVDDLRVPKTRA